jgi:hypothetical protein
MNDDMKCICGKPLGAPDHSCAHELKTENERLRELYSNQAKLAERGWNIDHLLECEEALRTVEEEASQLRLLVLTAPSYIGARSALHNHWLKEAEKVVGPEIHEDNHDLPPFE